MVEDAGHELTPEGREVVFPCGVVEAVERLLTVPPREVQMAAVTGLVSPRLGRERGVQPVIEGHAADRFPVEDVMIGGLQRGRIANREFLLAPAELRIVLLDEHPLRFERGDDFVDDRSGDIHAGGREAAAVVDRDELLTFFARERPFGFEGGEQRQVVLRSGPRDHPLEEGAAVGGVGIAVERLHVDEDGSRVRRVGGDHERRRVRNESNLSDWTHAVDACEVIEHGEGLHRHGQANARLEAVAEAGHRRTLSANHAVVVAVEEPHQAEARGLRPGDDFLPLDIEVDGGRAVGHRGRHQIPLSSPARHPWRRRPRGGPCSTRGCRPRRRPRATQCRRRPRSKSRDRCR